MHLVQRIGTTRLLKVVLAAAGVGTAAACVLPAAAQAVEEIAAYEQYEQGRGFEIKLVRVSTGQQLTVPPGVNTTADEFHPSLGVNSQLLVFTRATLVPQPDGDVVPPAERLVVAVRRQTGSESSVLSGVPPDLTVTNKGAGATFTGDASKTLIAYGTRFDPAADPFATRPIVALGKSVNGPIVLGVFKDDFSFSGSSFSAAPADQFLDFPHVAAQDRPGLRVHAISQFSFKAPQFFPTAGEGNVVTGITRLRQQSLNSSGVVVRGDQAELGSATQTVNHAMLRRGDGYIALDSSSGASSDIRTIRFPGESQPTDAPAPITTAEPERMPAWSPDGLLLGFVRTTGTPPRRELLVYDGTPGIQTILNPGINLGSEAPTPQLRDFQNVWGSLSLAHASNTDTPTPTLLCFGPCVASIVSPTSAIGVPLTLAPTVSAKKPVTGTKIGILIARVTGTKRVLGRSVPRISVVGSVPLGAAKRGTNRFPWNGRVNRKRLPRGTYLLTFRSLNRARRILSTSKSVRFSVTASGRITGARIQR